MKQCPYCSKEFKTWKSVRGHTSRCKSNSSEYFIDLNEGPIHFSELENLNGYQIKAKYSNLKSKLSSIRKTILRKGFNINCSIRNIWNKNSIIKAIQDFHNKNNKIPQYRDFEKTNGNYPSNFTVALYFGSWNNGIEAAGFEPNVQNGYGINTKASDGIIYRSRYEAKFVNKFLLDQYEYEIEPKYPEPYNKYYDWYLPKLNLYIELDGEIRPEIIEEKIVINKKLNRNLLVIKTKDINKYNNLEEIYSLIV